MAKARKRDESENYFWYQNQHLGQGATGFVYLCQHKETGQEFAAKVFSIQGMKRDDYVTERELSLLGKLKGCTHENIVKVIEIEKEKTSEAHVIIMEYCSGGSLYNMLEFPENAFGFGESNFKQVVFDVVSGMKYLTDQGMIHRDIKPGNILRYVRDDGSFVYKLTDFGAARELETGQEFVSIYGTEEYLHPDLYERGVLKQSPGKKFTANVDLWSLGVTFYHVATGKLPFRPYAGRQNRFTMFEITSKKAKGIISGVQKDLNGPIDWSDKLPEYTRLSQGLKEHVIKILASLLEADPEQGMKFDDLFQAVEQIKAMKVIHVYSAQSGTFHVIYANPEDNFARFQELVAIQTGVSARQQDLFYNNCTFKPSSMAKVSTYPDTTEKNPILVLGGDSIPSEKLCEHLELKKPKLHNSTSLDILDSDCAISKVAAANIYRCLHNVKSIKLSSILILESAENVITLLKRKARKYLDDAKAIENHCNSIVMKHEACINGCNFEVEVMKTLGNDDDVPKEILAELDVLEEETHSFKKKMNQLREDLKKPLEELRETAQGVLGDWEVARKWKDMNEQEKPENYVAMVETYAKKVEEIMRSFKNRLYSKMRCTSQDMEDHKFERFRLEEYFTKAINAMDASQARRQKLHENLQTWLEEVYSCRSRLKKMRKEVESYIEMFDATAISEEKWRADHMEKMKNVLNKVRTQVRRTISVQSTSSDQQHSVQDERAGEDIDQLGSGFIADINKQLYQLSIETKEAKTELEKGTETFKRFVEELVDGLNQKSRDVENEQ